MGNGRSGGLGGRGRDCDRRLTDRATAVAQRRHRLTQSAGNQWQVAKGRRGPIVRPAAVGVVLAADRGILRPADNPWGKDAWPAPRDCGISRPADDPQGMNGATVSARPQSPGRLAADRNRGPGTPAPMAGPCLHRGPGSGSPSLGLIRISTPVACSGGGYPLGAQSPPRPTKAHTLRAYLNRIGASL